MPDYIFDPNPLIPRKRLGYAEAYPRLDFIKAQKAIEDGRTFCVFERDGRDRVGQFEFVRYEDDDPHWRGLMHGQFKIWPDAPHIMTLEVAFRIRPSSIGVDHARDYALCPSCDKLKGVLVFVADWKCQGCHGLLMRSQLIDPEVRLSEKITELRSKIAGGRPKGMHHSTYRKQLDHIFELEKRAAQMCVDRYKMASVEHNRVVSSRWVSIHEDFQFQKQFSHFTDE
ncbi:MAG: hypothetical protein Q8R44_05040 [Novosphingobium sp.]|nr:hypothetical protein [Novosphingobium sp.]